MTEGGLMTRGFVVVEAVYVEVRIDETPVAEQCAKGASGSRNGAD